jgi:hypothetical protein
VLKLYEEIKYKSRREFTEHDYLVCALVETSTELRMYSLFALIEVGVWLILRAHRWPRRWVPRLKTLSTVNGTDVVKKYQDFIELAASLSQTYGQHYRDQLVAAL